MPINTVSLSTSMVPGPSAPAGCSWRGGRPVLLQIMTNSSVGTGDFTVEVSNQDLQLTGYSTVYPPTGSPTLTSTTGFWSGLSSAPYASIGSQAYHWNSSLIWPDGLIYQLLAPPAAVRLYSTGLSSNILFLSIVEGDGG